MGEIVPFPRLPDGREFTPTDNPVDIRTSQLPMRVTECDDGTIRLYPAVQHDCPVDDKAARTKGGGRAFGRTFSSEVIAVSAELAEHILTLSYGPDTAGRMLREADQGRYVFGQQRTETGNGYRWKGGVNVARDQSREEGYVIQYIGLRQHSSK